MRRDQEHFRGCLPSRAIGDALGRPVEVMCIIEIEEISGENGITDLVVGKSGTAEISDDT